MNVGDMESGQGECLYREEHDHLLPGQLSSFGGFSFFQHIAHAIGDSVTENTPPIGSSYGNDAVRFQSSGLQHMPSPEKENARKTALPGSSTTTPRQADRQPDDSSAAASLLPTDVTAEGGLGGSTAQGKLKADCLDRPESATDSVHGLSAPQLVRRAAYPK